MLKKLLLLSFLLLTSIKLIGQENAIYFVVQPSDMGIGVRLEHQFPKNYGLYASGTLGEYRFIDGYVKDHLKLSTGVLKYWDNSIFDGDKYFVSVGLCYHKYGERQFSENTFNESVFNPISFEVGTGTRIGTHFTTACVVDVLKWDISMNFGYVF